jgi:signal transduction histidine kinase
MTHTPLGAHLAALILWSEGGHVLYSSVPEQIGKNFAPDDELVGSFAGAVRWELVKSEDEAHIPIQRQSTRLLAMYSPVRDLITGRVIAVVEFYQPFDPLAEGITSAQHETWLIVGGATLMMYLLLASFIERVSATIVSQQLALRDKVAQLTDLLEQNDQLYERVQRATHSVATTSERLMRRISADLHDGAAQYLGTAALHLDQIAIYHREQGDERVEPHITRAQSALTRAIEEVRGVAAGLKIPQLEAMSLDMVIADAVVRHEQHTNTSVTVVVNDMPDEVSAAVKVTTYRVLQEALSNAYRHGLGVDQRVETNAQNGMLEVLISDAGPGFETAAAVDSMVHMGLSGMRDRVESLGGQFVVTSQIGLGTQVRMVLPFDEEAEEVSNDDE